METAQGFTRLGVEEFPPFVGRAGLLDVAALHGTPHLPLMRDRRGRPEQARERAGVELRPATPC